jgi:glycosyltransferase involved in cell wall biosynthesis
MQNDDWKRICLITPSIHMGGMQRSMVNLANQFSRQGFDVTLIALYKLDHFFAVDPSVHFVEPPVAPTEESKLMRIVSTMKHIRRVVRASGMKKVLVFGRFYSMLTMLALTGLGRDVYISDRASSQYRDDWKVDALTKLLARFYKPAGIVAQTTDSLRFQKKRFGENVPSQVIPNSVDIELIGETAKKKQVIAIGRFGDKLKGFDRLIAAWCHVEALGWRLAFAGGDIDAARKEGFIDMLEKANRLDTVDFLGKVKDVSTLLNESEIFVIPSRSEGFPNALLEALACQVMCISFDFVAGPRDLIRHGENGIIVPDGDILQLAKVIEKYTKDDLLRRKIAKNNDYFTSYSKEAIVRKYIQFIWNT